MARNFLRIKLLFVLFLFALNISLYSQDSVDTKYWIIFTDKGEFKPTDEVNPGSKAYKKGKELLTERAIERRLKVLPEDKLIDFGDLPMNNTYISQIEKLGINILAKSRWFNGVSAYMTKDQMGKVKKLDCVAYIKAVNKLYKQDIKSLAPLECNERYENVLFRQKLEKNVYNYGKSYDQLSLINVQRVHNIGITGKGVLVASLDDGFDWKNHEALKDLNIIEEYDFVNEDRNTADELDQKYEDKKEQGAHGTATLSSMAGFKEGKLIGPAFGSDFLLAKTEYVPTETPMEEDFWLEAAEWVESKGADIITSSLVYKTFDYPYSNNSYKYEDFDGKTAITTLAGERAAYLGIVVLNAIGNYQQTAIPSLGSASDGDSIIAVGAVSGNGNIAFFSSNGPTSDGRIKPDVCAQGVYVYVASKEKSNTYEYSNGTSFSAPLTAGVCALILSAHPEFTPMQVRDALRNTANNASTPNNILGWGVIDAYNAILYYGMAWSNKAKVTRIENNVKISISVASKYLIDENNVKVFYSVDDGVTFNENIMKYVDGNNDGNKSGEYSATINDIPAETNILYYFYSKDLSGNESYYPLGANKNIKKCYIAGM
jgi:serine protease AprX